MFRLNMCEKIVDKKYICTQLSQTCEPMKKHSFQFYKYYMWTWWYVIMWKYHKNKGMEGECGQNSYHNTLPQLV